MQKIANPVPRVVHPDWLHKKVRDKDDKFCQRKLSDMFRKRDDGVGVNGDIDHSKDSYNVEDMEDIMNTEKTNQTRPQPIVRSYGTNKEQHQVKANIVVIDCSEQNDLEGSAHKNSTHSLQKVFEEQIDRKVDAQGWLESKKRKFKQILDKKKRQRLEKCKTLNQINGAEMSRSIPNRKRAIGGVGSYFQSNDLALTRSHWQIIQILPNSHHGQLSAWVVVDGMMFKVPILVPRVFYLNSKAPVTEEFPGRRVNKTLPHGRQSHNLIEVVIDEDQFRTESKKLVAHLADPEVEGIYETKIPLEFNAILEIGCVCKVDKSAKKRNIQDGWRLSELNMKTTTECPYVEQSISFIYLYHSKSDNRAMYVGYFPASSEIYAVVVSPVTSKELSPLILERQFREASQSLSLPPVPNKGLTFKVDYVGNIKDAQFFLQRTITEYRNRHHGPAIAVIECPNIQQLKSGVRALEDFPCVTMPSNGCDGQYQALGWQVIASKIAMRRCAASSQYMNQRVALSQYAHIPLGNFEVDWLINTADIFLARALHDQQQLLWLSDNGIPDLGGNTEEAPCYIDEVNTPVLNYPGAYRKVTIELKIHHLAVNALVKSNQVNEMEGGVLFGLDQDEPAASHSGKQYFSDETTSCAPAFRVLKQLVQRCLSDAAESGNVFADAILQHLYRWLCSPKSKLHDPALHRMLHKVMQKVFALLLAELRKLGARIVFACFSRIIIDTGKSDLIAAKAYCDSVLKTVQARDLFTWIELEPIKYWHSLLFMDQYNYSGIEDRSEDVSAEESSEANTERMFSDSEINIIPKWAIAENLPKATQGHFILTVSKFLYLPWNHAKEEAAKQSCAMDDSCTPSITASTAEILEKQVTQYLKREIIPDFSDKLFKVVSEISHHKSKNNSQGDLKHKGDYALDFIKHVCAVLLLDQKVQNDVLIMRRNLLKYVRIGEFAPEAEFQNRFMCLTLPNVICSYCNDCRDLDLCNDRALNGQEWRCAVPQCGQPYDREEMENSLLQIVRQREQLYHLQDLVCGKCHQVKAAHLALHCGCAGSFACKEDASDFRAKMQVLRDVAVDQKFQLLQECVEWILETRSD